MMPMDDLNRTAVRGLLADAEQALALTDFEEACGNAEIVELTIAMARRNYIDLMRRSRPLLLSESEQRAFFSILERIKGRLELLGAPL